MPLRTEAYYRTIAEKALARLGVSDPPVPVEGIAASLGIPLRAVNLPQFFTAATVYEDGMPVMIVNWAKPEHERRAAIAHMLGHVLLLMEDPANGYPRSPGAHPEADLVARDLTLPLRMVIDQARLWFNDHRYLARLFGVDEEVMLTRMRDAGLIKGGRDGIGWDF